MLNTAAFLEDVKANKSLHAVSLQGQERVESKEAVERVGLTAEDVIKVQKTPAIVKNVEYNDPLHPAVSIQGQERVESKEAVKDAELISEDDFKVQNTLR